MCGCKNKINQSTTLEINQTSNSDCAYTINQLNQFKGTLFCIKEKELYNQTNSNMAKINSYLGITTSAIYYPNDFCYFQDSLDEINLFLSATDLSNCNYV